CRARRRRSTKRRGRWRRRGRWHSRRPRRAPAPRRSLPSALPCRTPRAVILAAAQRRFKQDACYNAGRRLPMSNLRELLGLTAAPVAITFRPSPPAGVAHVARREPAGCGYWKRAAAGEIFYTDAADHKNCPIGAHTHGVALSPDESKALEGLI